MTPDTTPPTNQETANAAAGLTQLLAAAKAAYVALADATTDADFTAWEAAWDAASAALDAELDRRRARHDLPDPILGLVVEYDRLRAAALVEAECGSSVEATFIEAQAELIFDEITAMLARRLATELTFSDVTWINAARCARWHPMFPDSTDGWSGADWANAMQGEAGAAGNLVKKLRRLELGITQADALTRQTLLAKLSREIGDTYLYLDLLAQHYGLDIAACITYAFNQISEREGFPERIDQQTVKATREGKP